MLKISEFSVLTDVPVKTIRYYEELGLLRPSQVDEVTGYRRFDEQNVERLAEIVYLKSLGFSLNEIKQIDDKTLAKKSKEIKSKIRELKNSLKQLSLISKNQMGEYIMNKFINDENLIGKWELIGHADTRAEISNPVYPKGYFGLKSLVFMPKGQGYWIITSWTKGYIFIKDKAMPYEFIDGKLVIGFAWDGSEVEYYEVYKNVDHKAYTLDEITVKDDTNIKFENDEKLIGIYKTVDFVEDIEAFNSKKRLFKGDNFIKALNIFSDGKLITEFANGEAVVSENAWTKGAIVSKSRATVEKLITKEIDGQTYLFREWKSGDYIYGHNKPCYYVFKKTAF